MPARADCDGMIALRRTPCGGGTVRSRDRCPRPLLHGGRERLAHSGGRGEVGGLTPLHELDDLLTSLSPQGPTAATAGDGTVG